MALDHHRRATISVHRTFVACDGEVNPRMSPLEVMLDVIACCAERCICDILPGRRAGPAVECHQQAVTDAIVFQYKLGATEAA